MQTILLLTLSLVLLLAAAGGILFYLFPGVIIKLSNWKYARTAGLMAGSGTINNKTYHFFTSRAPQATAQTVVLIHGLGDDKTSFLQAAAALSDDYNLFLPDLPGQGANARDRGADYSIAGQASFLHELLAQQGISNCHLAGNSMGGHISAAYALRYPQEVDSLTLINAPGVMLEGIEVYTSLGGPLNTKADLMAIMHHIMYAPPSLPGPIVRHMINQINANLDFVDNVMAPAIKEGADFDLKDRITGIKAPTLVLWGEHDAMVPFRIAEYFDQNIPNSRIKIIPKASHSPQLERPAAVGRSISNFIKKGSSDVVES